MLDTHQLVERRVTYDAASVEAQYVFRERITELAWPLQFHQSPSSANVSQIPIALSRACKCLNASQSRKETTRRVALPTSTSPRNTEAHSVFIDMPSRESSKQLCSVLIARRYRLILTTSFDVFLYIRDVWVLMRTATAASRAGL